MFKSILRTLPTLSGNFKLNCNVTKVKKIKNNIYNGYINAANIIPLKNSLLTNGVKIALLNDSYEFDVAKYYYYYNNIFYNDNFLFNKEDFQILDKYNNINSRNKDYEFGCNRLFFKQSGYQFCFYAPIYCDDYDSLPDYFEIKFNFGHNRIKILKIKIKDNDKENYLRIYLKKYLNKINDNIITMLPYSKQATYDGINVKTGGFTIHTDDIISQVYNLQTTINNFDYLLCSGFERNNLIMKQIIPLAFSFNIFDLLDENEKYYNINSYVNISGNYVKSNIHVNFYDFRHDYYEFKYKFKYYDKITESFKIKYTDNILNYSFPSLKESRYIKYKYSNKLTPTYSTWKLKYSDDNFPYYTNINYSFSNKSINNYQYGNFPIKLANAFPNAIENGNNLIVTFGNYNYNNYDSIYYAENNKFINAMNNNISSWFEDKNNFNVNNVWHNVKDNIIYYNGVLYDLTNIKTKIDKFAIFIDPSINIINNKNALYCKYLIDTDANKKNNYVEIKKLNVNNEIISNNIYGKIYKHNQIINNCFVKNNYIMEKNNKYGKYKKIENYNENNIYFKWNDVKKIFMFTEDEIKYLENTYIINSTELIPIENNSNFIDNNKFIFNIFNDGEHTEQYDWINKNILYSYNNSEKHNINNNDYIYINNILNNNLSTNKLHIYIKTIFISAYDILNYIINLKKQYNINKLFDLNKYNYIPINYINNSILEDYFILDNSKNEYVYVNTYNFKNIFPNISEETFEYKYGKFLNNDHIYEKLNNKENYKKNIYIKNRLYNINIKNNTIDLFDKFEALDQLNIDLPDTLDIFLRNINYNNNKFKYNNQYYDLYYYDKFVKLDKNLYEYMFNIDESTGNIKYFRALYLYTLDNNNIEYINPIKYYNKENIDKNELIYNINDNVVLNPVFLDIYKNNNSDNYIISLFDNNIIYENKDNFYLYRKKIENGYINISKDDLEFLYNIITPDNLTDFLININILSKYEDIYNINMLNINNDLKQLLITYYINSNNDKKILEQIIDKIINIILYPQNELDYILKEKIIIYIQNNYEFPQIYKNTENIEIKLVKDNDKNTYINNINIFNKNNKTYAYYNININLNNTNKAFNILNNSNHLKFYNTINNINITTFIKQNFKFICPYINEDIFIKFKSLINTIIDMTILNINLKYSADIYDNGNTEKSYLYNGIFYDNTDKDKNIYNINKYNSNKNIKLNRYLNSISPYLYKIDNNYINNIYQLYFKNINNNINSNNIYRTNINVYKYPGIKVCTKYNLLNHTYDIINYSEIEYKSFNDNKYYNLEHEIIINFNRYFTYDELLIYESEKNIISEFKKYLKNNNNYYDYNDDEILFLFNKYDVQCLSEAKKVNNLLNKKLYTLKIKLTLK